ncbi:hypothetical protein GCM10023198_03530 [Promicromonospora umidemergens]|uniref:Flagellin-like protein n=1 Tax=Promicromonospora umidemergens TaxID=629679 RepID=A0ABP8WGK2_9MICO
MRVAGWIAEWVTGSVAVAVVTVVAVVAVVSVMSPSPSVRAAFLAALVSTLSDGDQRQ